MANAQAQELSYEAILNKGWSEIPEPKFLPDGSYRFRITGGKAHQPKTPEGNTRVVIGFEPQEPMEDVDDVAFDALGKDYDLSQNVIWYTVWLQKAQDFAKLRNVMEKAGLNMGDYNGPEGFKQSLDALKGREIVAHVINGFDKQANGEMAPANKITSFTELN